MNKYQLAKLDDIGLGALHTAADNMQIVIAAHHHTLVFAPNTDVFYLADMIQRLKELIDECITEENRRKEKNS